MSDEVRSTGLEIKIRTSPEQSPEKIVNQVIEQLRPYLESVLRTYQVTYRIRLIIQPVFVKTPQPPITVRAIVKRPVTEDRYRDDGADEEETGEETEEVE
mgnify:CR=1 FL=1